MIVWTESKAAGLPGRIGVIVQTGVREFAIQPRGTAVGSLVADADGYLIDDASTLGTGRVLIIGNSGTIA